MSHRIKVHRRFIEVCYYYSVRITYFSNRCGICKVAKVVRGNRSDSHCIGSETRPSILLLDTQLSLSLSHTHTHTHGCDLEDNEEGCLLFTVKHPGQPDKPRRFVNLQDTRVIRV